MALTYEKLEGGKVRCKETGCVIHPAEQASHDAAYEMRKAAHKAAPKGSPTRDDLAELVARQAALLEELTAKKAPKA